MVARAVILPDSFDEAVNARFLSALKSERLKAAEVPGGNPKAAMVNYETFIEHVRNAIYASKIVSYAQGFVPMRAASEQYGWNLEYGDIALLWPRWLHNPQAGAEDP